MGRSRGEMEEMRSLMLWYSYHAMDILFQVIAVEVFYFFNTSLFLSYLSSVTFVLFKI